MAPFLLGILLVGLTIWLGNVLLLIIRRGSFEKQWRNQAAVQAGADDLMYVVLGDSTASGVGARSIQTSYPYRIAVWLQKQTGRTVAIKNYAVAGATIADVVKNQLPKLSLQDRLPNVVTVSVGANDIAKFTAESFESNMRALLSALPRESYVALVPSFGGRKAKLDWKVQEANKITTRLIQSTNHHLIDMYSATRSMKGIGLTAADLYHPSTKAYSYWALAFQTGMAERIPELISEKR